MVTIIVIILVVFFIVLVHGIEVLVRHSLLEMVFLVVVLVELPDRDEPVPHLFYIKIYYLQPIF